ncbi:hypothetical protein CYMTET_11446 [Cymbomonas tetramitiformis]|uniref:DUF659 domain-containing protein n=1 Tax=Cymbomonas tetramitiformis TaxID=36881 RepID=A0AAE0GMA5_9CHLO|nr:hypothetical protein CYMTET_11446 [Cymbomonas tetramitiformis]
MSITASLDTSKQQKADADLALALYETDTPFHVLEHPSMKAALRSVAAVGNGYSAPNRFTVATTLLDSAHSKVSVEIAEQRQPIRKFGTTAVSDGATDGSKRPILNLLNVSPALVEFIKAQNCEGKVKDKEFIADFIASYIEGHEDPYSIVQVLMDNATRGSWPLIEERCPWVVVGPCEPHVSDLELEDFVKKIPFFRDTVARVHTVRKFVRSHGHVHAKFKELCNTMLTQPGPTRFATVYIGLSNLLDNLPAISKTLAHPDIREYVRKNRSQRASADSPSLLAQFDEAKAIVDNMLFPHAINLVKASMRPVAKLLRFADAEHDRDEEKEHMILLSLKAKASALSGQSVVPDAVIGLLHSMLGA